MQDAATGQYYAKARYFTTQLGRWSQPEPLLKGVPEKKFLANPQLLNPYVYCVNNPLIYTDPDGLAVSFTGTDAATLESEYNDLLSDEEFKKAVEPFTSPTGPDLEFTSGTPQGDPNLAGDYALSLIPTRNSAGQITNLQLSKATVTVNTNLTSQYASTPDVVNNQVVMYHEVVGHVAPAKKNINKYAGQTNKEREKYAYKKENQYRKKKGYKMTAEEARAELKKGKKKD